jgi:hypothetical protein
MALRYAACISLLLVVVLCATALLRAPAIGPSGGAAAPDATDAAGGGARSGDVTAPITRRTTQTPLYDSTPSGPLTSQAPAPGPNAESAEPGGDMTGKLPPWVLERDAPQPLTLEEAIASRALEPWYYDSVYSLFSAETEDPGWSAGAERQITEALIRAHGEALDWLHVECRRTICLADYGPTDRLRPWDLHQHMDYDGFLPRVTTVSLAEGAALVSILLRDGFRPPQRWYDPEALRRDRELGWRLQSGP